MRAEDALQLPFADLMYGDLSPLAYNTRFGLALVSAALANSAPPALPESEPGIAAAAGRR